MRLLIVSKWHTVARRFAQELGLGPTLWHWVGMPEQAQGRPLGSPFVYLATPGCSARDLDRLSSILRDLRMLGARELGPHEIEVWRRLIRDGVNPLEPEQVTARAEQTLAWAARVFDVPREMLVPREPSDIIEAIDAVTELCQEAGCGNRLRPDGPSGDFCSEDCQEAWRTAFNGEPPTHEGYGRAAQIAAVQAQIAAMQALRRGVQRMQQDLQAVGEQAAETTLTIGGIRVVASEAVPEGMILALPGTTTNER